MMNAIDVKNCRFSKPDNLFIDCVVLFEGFDNYVPFTASQNDSENHGREIFNRAMAGEFGAVADYVQEPLPPAPIPQTVSMRQARLALLEAGLLDTVSTAMQGAGQAEQIEWEYATEVRRDSALVAAMAVALGLNDAQLDALFVAAAGK